MSKPTIDHVSRLEARTEEIPNPPPHMWAAWKRTIETHAPDLMDMLWDADAAKVAEVVR